MSFLEENADVKMDSGDWERADPQCSSEDPARGPLEPDPSLSSLSSAGKMANAEPQRFTLHDQDHKVLVLDSPKKLIAVLNKKYILPETFFVSASHLISDCEKKGSPVFLAVSKGELFLCCEMDKIKSQPDLRLKKKKLSHLLSGKGDLKCFTFYRMEVGCRNTLESAAHAGWFISTANADEPVTMTDKLGSKRHTEFSFMPVRKVEMCPSEVSE